MLTDEEVKEFQALVLSVFGLHLSLTKARDQGERLIRLFELMIRRRKQLVKDL
jgi:hypothetical protein